MTAEIESLIALGEQVRRHYQSDLLKGQVALVTGASRGIGRAIAVAMGALGAKVVVNYSGSEEAAGVTRAAIEGLGSEALCVRFNVGKSEEVTTAVKQLEKDLGGIDILVNNAGISRDNLLMRMKDEEWDATLEVNLKGCFNCCRAVVAGMMKKRRGKIINISSVIGLTGNAGQAAYASSKAGVFGLTMSIAREIGSRNIQVNAIAPGYVSTDMTAALGEKLVQDVLGKIPLGRLGEPVDIARMAVFLASPLSDYVTGQTFAVDGGMTM
jgi:3-oxoacyl-[acyl-carrier protein] reductase